MSKVLITGGAGFIGSNLADRLLSNKEEVTIFDNLSRYGTADNIEWLRRKHGNDSFSLIQEDVIDYNAVRKAAEGTQQVFHLAGQVAVTTSVIDPRNDFLINALGTFNVLEAAREVGDDPIVVYASTNKVYGGMEDIEIALKGKRYVYTDYTQGIPETITLDFHSPYGCSKGAGDQYAHDYFRIYGLRTIVFRQSCIYGYRQFGLEDQGWVAWFIIASLKKRPVTIYGDGKQVRDILFIDDLIDAYEIAVQKIDISAGQIFNVGGGPENTMSIWSEFSPLLENLLRAKIKVDYSDWRPGDQKVYVSDISKIGRNLGWHPKINVEEGIEKLFYWVKKNLNLFTHI